MKIITALNLGFLFTNPQAQNLYKGRMVVIFLMWLISLHTLATAQTNPNKRNFSGTEVEFMNGQIRLAGVILLPNAQPKSPGVVIIHGSGDADRNHVWAREFAEGLVERGIAVLLPDKRGSGKSGGDWKKASFEELADDAIAAIELLRKHPKVKSEVVGIMGLSQGGKIAPLAATRSPRISFVVSISSSTAPLAEQVSDEVEKLAEQAKFTPQQIERVNEIQRRATHFATTGEGWEEYRTLLEKELKSDLAGRDVVEPFPQERNHWVWQWVHTVGNFDPLPHWQKLNVPALIAYGSRDTQIRVGKSVTRLTNATESNSKHYTLIVYGDSSHGLRDPQTRKVRSDFLAQLTAWINGVAPKTSPPHVSMADAAGLNFKTVRPNEYGVNNKMKKGLMSIALSLLIMGAFAFNTPAQTSEKPNVAILIFDGVQIIDYTGPYEVFGSRRRRNVFTVAEKPDVITTAMGMKVVPAYTFENHPKADILVIPGGGNSTPGKNARGVGVQMDNEKLINWIQEKSKDAKYVLSVCNGAFLLAKADLLTNLEATTTAGMINDLKEFSPTTKLVYDRRFVDNGKIITTAGLSSGIDGALHVIEKMDGIGWAKMIAISIEYDWRPESDYARAQLADLKLPGSIYGAFYSFAQPLDFNGGADEWEEKWVVSTTSSAAEILENINKKWSAEVDWSKVRSNRSESVWTLTDKQGKTWTGRANVIPMAKEKGKIMVILKIVNTKTKSAGSDSK